MIIFKDLAFGDKVHVVNETNNVVRKKRITMTDPNGVEWARYDREHWEYNIEELEYVGKRTYVDEGETVSDSDEVESDKLYFKFLDGLIREEDSEADSWLAHWFSSEEEATNHVTHLKTIRKDIE
jgi:hypothetical protein